MSAHTRVSAYTRARAGCHRGQPCTHGSGSTGDGSGLRFAPPLAAARAGGPRSAGPGLGPASAWPGGRPGRGFPPHSPHSEAAAGRVAGGSSQHLCPMQITEGDIGPFSAVKVPVIFSPVIPGTIQTRFKVTFNNQECPAVSAPLLATHGHCRVDPSWAQGPSPPPPRPWAVARATHTCAASRRLRWSAPNACTHVHAHTPHKHTHTHTLTLTFTRSHILAHTRARTRVHALTDLARDR